MGNTCCARDENEKNFTDTKVVESSEKMRAASKPYTVEPVEPVQNRPAMIVQPPVEVPKEEPKPRSEPPKDELKIEEVKVDEHAGAVDYEKTTTMNAMTPAVKKTYESKRQRNVRDYAELREYYTTPEQKLRNKKTGDTWSGGVVRGVPHGWGMFITKNGEVLEGLFLEGHHKSHMRQIQADGTSYEGGFVDHKREGKGVITYPDGRVINCNTWVNGNPTGQMEETDSSGKTLFKGTRTDKGPEGVCVIAGKDFVVEGTFKDGVSTNATKQYKDGRHYVGALSKDMSEEGQGTFTFVDGRKFQGPFSKGLANGEGTFTSDLGKASKQTWKNGKRV